MEKRIGKTIGKKRKSSRRGFALGIRTAISILRTQETLGGKRTAEIIALESLLTQEER